MQQGRNPVKIQRTLAQPIHPHSSRHVSYTLLLLSGMNFLFKLFSVLKFSSPSDVFFSHFFFYSSPSYYLC